MPPTAPAPTRSLRNLDLAREAEIVRRRQEDARARRFGLKGIRGAAQGSLQTMQAREAEGRPGYRPSVRRTTEGVPVIPFTSAAHEQTEGAFIDESFTPGGNENNLDSPQGIPAGGYLRAIRFEITGTGGTLGAGVLHPDYPWNVLSRLALTDVNGGPIFGPTDGYAALWQNIIGGAGGRVQDPRTLPGYVATINFRLAIRIPMEISHLTALGCIANQDARSQYRIEAKGNTSGNLFTTAPTTAPTIRVRAWVERFTIPNEFDILGQPQAQMPPRLGTAQYLSERYADMAAGANQIDLTRTGQLLRTLIFINRTTAANTPRSDAVFPDPIDFDWNQRHIHQGLTQDYIASVLMREKLPDLVARDTGVFAFPNNTSLGNGIGDDQPTFWWPTTQSDRIQLRGTSASAGRTQVLTGDVAPAEVIPEERYELTSQTGFQPEVGTPVRGA